MTKQSIYILDRKSADEVKQAFIYYMSDKNATSKQIKDAANSRYAKIDSIDTICSIVKRLFNVENVFRLVDVGQVLKVSEALTELINKEEIDSVRHELKNLRSYVNKYKNFLVHCTDLNEKVADSSAVYNLAEDPDKPFIDAGKFDEIVEILHRKKNVILQGAPGVGKTFLARKIAYQLIGQMKDDNIEIIQFHQSYSYEDFMQGIRPTTSGEFIVRNGVFYSFCERAREHPEETYVFIIDEINRGNLSKIFGELMMLIESDKRSPRYALRLTYSEECSPKFYVPENVYIIGCMNTADRSIAIVDYALRRRFAFCPIEPELGERFKAFLSSELSKEFVDKICRKLNRVNTIIAESASLGKGLEIGHSYFCQINSVDDEDAWWKAICQYELFPYLQEICFDNAELCDELCNILSE